MSIDAKRLGHVSLETPDLGAQVAYLTDVIGLKPCHQDRHGAALATKTGELAVHLHAGTASRCVATALEVAPSTDLSDGRARLQRLGIEAEIRTDSAPGVRECLSFEDPKGTRVDLFHRTSFTPAGVPSGIDPIKIGHVAFVVDDPKAMCAFYEEVLGFRVSDWVADYFVFMRCGPDHHTLNFLRGPGGSRMHHFAFELRDSAHLISSCEVLAAHKLLIDWGPVRHGPGHNIATYHRNQENQVVELFTELDRMSDEDLGYFEPRPWHGEFPQRPKTWRAEGRRDVWGPAIPANFLLNG